MSSIHSRLSRATDNLSSLPTAILVVLVAALSYVSMVLGSGMSIPPHNVSPLWPTNAVVLVVLLAVPRRLWPILITTAYSVLGLLHVLGAPIAVSFWLTLGNAVEVIVAAFGVRYFFKSVPRLNSTKSLAQYSLIAAVLAPFAGAFIGALATTPENYWLHWRMWFLSDGLALFTLPPALWGLIHLVSSSGRKSRLYYLELVTLTAVLILFGYATLVASGRSTPQALLYPLVPLLLWFAFRFGSGGTSISVFVVSVLSIWGAVHGRGPFTASGPIDSVLSLQLFLLFTAAPFMFLAALVEERKHVEETVRESEERLRLAQQAAGIGTFEWNIQSGVNRWTPELEVLYGLPRGSFPGTQEAFARMVHPDDFPRVDQWVAESILSGSAKGEWRVIWPDGTVHWLAGRWQVFKNEQGEAARVIGINLDITERKQAEEKLKASEEYSRQLVKSSSVAMIVSRGLEQKVELMNDRFTALFGYTMDDVPDVAHWWPLAYPDDAYRQAVTTEWQARVEKAIRNGTDIEPMEVTVRCKDGSTRHIEAQLSRMGDTNLVTLINLTERKRAEEALRESKERLRLAVQAGKMYAYEWDISTDKVVRSAECIDILGKDEPTLTTRRELMARVHPDDREQLAASFLKLTPQSPNCQISYRVLGLDGRMIWVEKSARAFFDQDGRMLRMTGVIADITARKQEEEIRFRHVAIVESSDDAIISKTLEGIITSWNAGAQHIFGYTEAEALGQSITILIPSELRDDENRILQRLRAGERIEHYETIRVAKGGKKVNVSLTISPLRASWGGIVGVSKIARDITERKRAEDLLRESEGRFRLVANTAPVLIWMSGTDKLCNYFNQPWLEFTGRPVEAELGNGWAEGVHPEDLVACMDIYTQAFDRRESFQMEYRLRRHDGEYRWLLDIGVPRFNADQSFAGYIGSCIDVTDRKLAEESLASMGRKLIEAHEEERTRIARELHDDITQRIALLAIELDRWNQHLPESAVDLHRHIHDARQRLSELAKDTQTLSHRLHSSKLEYLGIVGAASSFCKELSEQQQVQVDFSHSDIPRTVPKEVSLSLFRVLQEALQNAVKHSGVRHFKVELRGTPEEIRLTVTDSGIGFDWRDAISGRGLGLISMRERLQLVKGGLSIKSGPGRGTTISAHVSLGSNSGSMRTAG